MDDRRFDSLVKSFASGGSRRSMLKGVHGLGGGALAGGALLAGETDAARRPTPTPPPVRCPGKQVPIAGICTCPGGLSNCGPDCCNPSGSGATHSECCDNSCCFGTCYAEESCCPTNIPAGGGAPTHMVCDGACLPVSDGSCCVASDCGEGTWECVDYQCVGSICSGDDVLCGDECCLPDQCVSGQGCCSNGFIACGGNCCNSSTYYCDDEERCSCLPGTEPCGELPGGCCPDGQCNTNAGICCQTGNSPCDDGCCADGQCSDAGECCQNLVCGAYCASQCCAVDDCVAQGYSAECVQCAGHCDSTNFNGQPCGDGQQCSGGRCITCGDRGASCLYDSQCCSHYCCNICLNPDERCDAF